MTTTVWLEIKVRMVDVKKMRRFLEIGLYDYISPEVNLYLYVY